MLKKSRGARLRRSQSFSPRLKKLIADQALDKRFSKGRCRPAKENAS
jgi:hypothetical protein